MLPLAGSRRLLRLRPHQVLVASSNGVGAVLREAAASGQHQLLRAMLGRGISPFDADVVATTALHRAASAPAPSGNIKQGDEDPHAAACRVLVAAGAECTAINKRNLSPLDLAIQHKKVAAPK